jgi:hypothetical protein
MSTDSDWRKHPVTVGAAAFGAAVMFFYNVILPTHTVSLQNRIAALSEEPITRRAKVAEEKVHALEGQLKEAQRVAAEFQLAKVFVAGSPYPVGLDRVKIGDTQEDIINVFPKDSIEMFGRRWWSVKDQHPLFKTITYYFDGKKVGQIAFAGSPDASGGVGEVLYSRLVDALGPATEARGEYYRWKTNSKLAVFLQKPASALHLLPVGYHPGSWAEAK